MAFDRYTYKAQGHSVSDGVFDPEDWTPGKNM